MAVASFSALVHYPDDSSNVRIVFETPVRGALLAGPAANHWVAEDVKLREGELGGQAYTTEVWVVAALEE
jgi:hypothetical protein